MTKKQIKLLTIAVLSLVSLLYGLLDRQVTPGDKGAEGAAIVRKVFDGDTVEIVSDGRFERVRLVGIDAPEMGQRPWGVRAKRHLEELIDVSDGRVRVEYDVERHDRYGRVLAYLWNDKGKMINEAMVADGFAVLYTFPPNVKHVALLRRAQEAARNAGLGIWSGRGLRQLPSEYRREHPRRY